MTRGSRIPTAEGHRGYETHDSFQYLGFDQKYYKTPIGKYSSYNMNGFDVDDGGFGIEVYAYDCGRTKPYGAHGTVTDSGIGAHQNLSHHLMIMGI